MTYPPAGGASGVDSTYSTDSAKSDGYDPTGDGGGVRYYRAIAFGVEDHPLAASPVKSVTTKAIKALGGLAIGPDGPLTQFDWSPYAGPTSCYSFYKLVYSAEDSTPSYLDGAAVAWVGTDQGTGSAAAEALDPGTYWFRLEAIRQTSLGKFIVAQTDAVQYSVP